jgi:sigma-B regulation protein RsbU (phosphoserine phosphatase)
MYDVIALPDGSVLVAILDVSGHGVPAALYAAILRSALHHQTAVTCDVGSIAAAMNREFASVATEGTFATCFLARLLQVQDGAELEYVSAGHDPALITTDRGDVTRLTEGHLVMGVDARQAYRTRQARLNRGDRLVLFTDGIHEVRGADRSILGRDRLAELLIRSRDLSPTEQVQAVLREVRRFQGRERFDDDITLLSACVAE